ncbi:ankyrin repeat domain-containing protein 36C-like isoform X2 [Dysidea avara]|uniref:ankyrin repeat domain-containing protein 36C-like isoform X2 n=1 Tax=Dysidea avara TaxID=196820 RepID=UPI00332F8F70
MPKISKLLKKSKKKGDGDTASISSKASVLPPSEGTAVHIFSYTIKKDKDLPKLHKAAWRGDTSKIKELAKPSSVNQLDKQSRTALHLACAQGDAGIATHLLSCKANTNSRDLDGRTPLLKAVDSNQSECVKALLDAGVDSNAADKDGLTPLHIAAHRGMQEVATMLLERDARIDAVDKLGSCPLHLATIEGHNNFVAFLINDGANVNAMDGQGRTPLMLATEKGRIGILKLLLQNKPDVKLKDEKGCTARDHAIINNNNDCAQLIKDYEASLVQSSGHTSRPNSMLIDDPKLALTGRSFRGPATDNTGDLNDSKTDEGSVKLDASNNSWNSNDEESSQAVSGSNRGPSLLGALKLQHGRGDQSLMQQTTKASGLAGGAHLTAKPPLTTSAPLQQQQQKQMSPEGKKASKQSEEDFPLDSSFDDTDSDEEYKQKAPQSKIVSSTPNVVDKKLPGLSFSFDKKTSLAGIARSSEKESTAQLPSEQATTEGTKPDKQMVDDSATKKVEKVDNKPAVDEDTSSNFDSSPLSSVAEDDFVMKQLSSDSDEDDFPDTGYVPSVGNALTRQERKSSLKNPPQQLAITEKDKILELARSSFLEMDDTPRKSASDESSKDAGSPSHNLGTFSPITPLPDKGDISLVLPNDSQPANKSAIRHVTGAMSPQSESDSSLDTDSVIRKAEEIERSVEKSTYVKVEPHDKDTTVKPAAPVEKDKSPSEGSDWDSEPENEEGDDLTSSNESTDKGHNALAGLGARGLPDPFSSHTRRSSKLTSKPNDYFNVYNSDSDDDNIEELLSPEKNVGKNDSSVGVVDMLPVESHEAVKGDKDVATAITDTYHPSHTSDTANRERKQDDTDGAMEFVNPFVTQEGEDDQQVSSEEEEEEESESEWEKELKDKRDHKPVVQSPAGVATDQRSVPATDDEKEQQQQQQQPQQQQQQESLLVNDEPILTSTSNSISSDKHITHTHSSDKQEELVNELLNQQDLTEATRSLRDNTDGEMHKQLSSPVASEEVPSLPASPTTLQDKEALKRYQQKENELLMVLEGRRKQLDSDKADEATDGALPTSSRADKDLVNVRKPSVSDLRSVWETQAKPSEEVSDSKLPSLPPLHNKGANKVELEPIRSTTASQLQGDSPHFLLNTVDSGLLSGHTTAYNGVQPTPAHKLGETKMTLSDEESISESLTSSHSHGVDDQIEPLATTAELTVENEADVNLVHVNLEGQKQQLLTSPLKHTEMSLEDDSKQSSPKLVAHNEPQTKSLSELQQEIGRLVEKQGSSDGQLLEQLVTVTDPTNILVSGTTSFQQPQTTKSVDGLSNSHVHVQQPLQGTTYLTRHTVTHEKATSSCSDESSLSTSIPLDFTSGHQGSLVKPSSTDHFGVLSSSLQLQYGQGAPLMGREAMLGDMQTDRELRDDNDDNDELINGNVSLSSQHTTTELSTTHDIVSPVPRLSSSLQLRPGASATFSGGLANSLLESSGVSALQESLRKTQRQLERAQNAEATAKTGQKRMEAQLKEFHRKRSDLSAARAQLEESKLDLEMVNRSMKYQLEQESIARSSADNLVAQLRQQLGKIEHQLRKEKESHQKTSSKNKELELEYRTVLIGKQQLQERFDDVQTQLKRERDSWKLQETLYNERLKVLQDMQQESNKAKAHQVLTQLEESDVARHSLMEKHSTLQQQLAQAQVQLSKEQQQREQLQMQLTSDIEANNEKLLAKSSALVEAEKSLLLLQQQFDATLAELKSKAEMLSTKLDEEAANKKQTEAELFVVKSQLEKTNNELHTALKEKIDVEKELHAKAQEHLRQSSLMEKDLANSQERQQDVASKLQTMETKLTTAENEAKQLQSSFFEQTNRISTVQRELDHCQQLLTTTEEKLRSENELRVKLESQLSTSNEKLTNSQSELAYLRAQLDLTSKKITDQDVHSSEAQDKFTSILESLKVDHQQARNSLEEKLQSLRDQLMAAKEETARSNLEKNSLSQELLYLKQELERSKQDKQAVEMTLLQTKEVSSNNRASQQDLQRQIHTLTSKLAASKENYSTSQQCCSDLQEQLTRLKQRCTELEQKVALSLQECSAQSEVKLELEAATSALNQELEKHQVDVRAKDEHLVQLSTQIKHLQDVRSGLEQTTTSLRGEIHDLQTQLTTITAERDRALLSAEESKGLWETEIKSRSQLGLKLMQLQKSQSDHTSLLENERKKARKALEIKKNAERKMESHHERSIVLQEESVSLKSQLRSMRKKVKEFEENEHFLRTELNSTQQQLQAETDSLRGQLLKVSTELRTESLLRKEADSGLASLKKDCEKSRSQLSLSKVELRDKEKVRHQLDRANRKLKEELKCLKEELVNKYTPTNEIELFKMQIEDKAKRELQAKLDEVNAHLEQQTAVQATLEKIRSESELQWQSRFEQTTGELKRQLKKVLMDAEELRVERDSKDAEAKRYKELYEVESARREKLSNKLEMAKEYNTSQLSTHMEQRPYYPTDLSTSLSRGFHHVPMSSSLSQPNTSVPLKSSTNDLLTSVRQELDKSIAKHLDSVSTTAAASRPQSKYHHTSQLAPKRTVSKKDAHITSIAQNYFV